MGVEEPRSRYNFTNTCYNRTTTMKTALVLAALLSSATAFAPIAFVRPTASAVMSAAPEDEEAGLDLNLEEMFDMFDAADKDEKFDDAIKKVKKDD